MSSKNKKKADATKQTVCTNDAPVSATPDKCKPKHWFGVQVKDEDGNPVKNVKVHVKLNDGSQIDPTLGADGTYKTASILDASTPCTVSFPEILDCEWWPDGSAAPKATEAGKALTVADGDCALSLATNNGYRDYHTIWDQSQNDELKKTRPNPDELLVADVLNGPALKQKTVDKPVDAVAVFVLKNKKLAKLKMVLVDKDLKPLNGWVWSLTSPSAANGTTEADGLIEFDDIDPTKTAGTLKVTIKKPVIPPPAPTTTPATPPSPPPYPPAIKPPDFIDKDPVKPADSDTMEWTLKVGSLPPAAEKTGVKARLHDLGFGCDVDSDDTLTTRAIKNFQKLFLKKTDTGAYADVQADLDSTFSNP